MRAFAVIAFTWVVLLVSPGGHAEDGAAYARAHFANGVRLYDAKEYEGALAEFRAAYGAKPAAALKRNIALCLKGLARYPEAIDALEEMLAGDEGTLKPDVREGALRAIAEMSALVANVRLRVVYGGSPPPTLTVVVDGQPIPPAKLDRPIRLMPGEHVFRATAPGYFDAEHRQRFGAGVDEATVELNLVALEIVRRARLIVRTNVLGSTIEIDGVAVGTGSFMGEVPIGQHNIRSIAMGYRLHETTVLVVEGQPTDLSIDMTSSAEAPPSEPPRTLRLWYASAGLGVFGETLTFAQALDDPGQEHGFAGGAFVARAGRRIGPLFSVGIYGELGGARTGTYTSAASGIARDAATMVVWALAPEVRVRSRGQRLRAVAGLALGLEGQWVNAQAASSGSVAVHAVTAGGTSVMALAEGGGQIDIGRAFVEATLFVDAHGLGAPRTAEGRLFDDSGAIRGGLRLLFGYTF